MRTMGKFLSLDYEDRFENYPWSSDGKYLICSHYRIDNWGIVP